MSAVIGVLGCNGGIGASSFAAALARASARGLLVDLDPAGGGIDVLLGIERQPGARWSSVEVDGGRLDPTVLTAGLPRWGPCAVLAADVPQLDADVVLRVLDAAATGGTVVLDLPRNDCAERAAGLLHCDLVVLLARCDMVGVAAAHAAIAGLPDLPAGLVLRRGPLEPPDAAAMLGLPELGRLTQAVTPVRAERLPRDLRTVARGVLAGADGAGLVA